MHCLVRFSVATAVAVAIAGCGSGKPRALVGQAELAQAGLQYYWRVVAPLDAGENISRVFLVDENFYCLTDRNRLLAFEAAGTGEYKWSCVIAKPGVPVFEPSHADKVRVPNNIPGINDIEDRKVDAGLKPFDAVFMNTLTHALVLDRSTGAIVRNLDLKYPANAAGASDGSCFFYASTSGRFTAVKLIEAEELWSSSALAMVTAPVKCLNNVSGLGAALVYVGSHDGGLFAARAEDGKNVWQANLSGPIVAAFHVDRRGCFVCGGNRLYALDPATKALLWPPFAFSGEPRSPTQVGQNSVFQYAESDKFYALNITSGKERWSMPDGRKALAVINGVVYLLDSHRNLVVVDEVLGTQKYSLPMVGFELFAANTKATAIYAATRDGRLACIRPQAAQPERLTPDMLRKGE